MVVGCGGEERAAVVGSGDEEGAARSVPMFRGNPARTGVNPGPGVEGSPGLLWRFETGDRVLSSPAVVDGVVYIGSDDGKVYALDALTGEELWSFDRGPRVEAFGGRPVWDKSSPAVADGILYIGGAQGHVYALDAATGEQRWWFETGGEVKSSPTVVDGVVYVGSFDTYMYALDAVKGEERWRFKTGDIIRSSPAVADGIVYFGSKDNHFYALNATTGEELWRFETSFGGSGWDYVHSSPAVVDGLVYFGTNDLADYYGSVYALDARTGEELWRFDPENGTCSSPAVVKGILYIGSDDRSVYALDATTGEKLWRFEAHTKFRSSPTVTGGVAYIGSGVSYIGSGEGYVHALDTATGDELWRFRVGDWIDYSSPAVLDGVVYIGSTDGYVYAITEEALPTAPPSEATEAALTEAVITYERALARSDLATAYALESADFRDTCPYEKYEELIAAEWPDFLEGCGFEEASAIDFVIENMEMHESWAAIYGCFEGEAGRRCCYPDDKLWDYRDGRWVPGSTLPCAQAQENERLLAALPQFPGAEQVSSESALYSSAYEGIVNRHVLKATYEAPTDASARDVIDFYVQSLAAEWQDTYPYGDCAGCGVSLTRGTAEVSINTHNMFDPRPHTFDVQVDSKGARPTPVPTAETADRDVRAREVLLESEVGKALLAGREEGRDYWLSITQLTQLLHGQRAARIQIVFAEPVFYAGEIATASDQCQGTRGEFDPDDPCHDEPWVYGTRYVTFADVRDIHGTVEVDSGRVVNIFAMDTPPDIVDDMIEYFKSRQGH